MPALPKEVFSVLGPLPVAIESDLTEKESALGITRFRPRHIGIDAGSGPETQWQTLGHEITHVAMWDGGCHDILTNEQAEAVCNALGTYLAAAVRAGYIKITVPRTRSSTC